MTVICLDPLTPVHRAWQTAEQNAREPAGRLAARHARTAWDAAADRARQTYATRRGWIHGGRPFSVAQLRTGRRAANSLCDIETLARPKGASSCAWDHPEYFRHPGGRPAAIVVHVYADDFDACVALAAQHGLKFTPLARSWYFPGGCLAGVCEPKETP